MLKKLMVFVLTLMGAMLLCTGVQAAASPDRGTFADFSYTRTEGCTTVLTDLNGREYTFAGVLQPTSLEAHDAVSQLAAYAIYRGEELVLSVSLHDIVSENSAKAYSGSTGGSQGSSAANGYYAVSFAYGEDDRYQAFVTGLTQANVTEVQTKVIAALTESMRFEITDLGFIDAEKQYDILDEKGDVIDHDTGLCWATSAANLLQYTGWGAKAGFGSTDYLLDCFVENFTDSGGYTRFGLEWFFSGSYVPKDDSRYSASSWAMPTGTGSMAYGTFRGFLPGYDSEQLMESFYMSQDPMQIYDIFERLENGYGVNMNFDYYGSNDNKYGHAITLWGYVLDTAAFGRENCFALLVTDSDSDVTFGENRRTAPNCLSYRRISPVDLDGVHSWKFNYYSRDMYLSDFVTLVPWSDAIKIDSGTHNTADADPGVQYLVLNAYNNGTNRGKVSHFASDDIVLAYFGIKNYGGTTTGDTISYRLELIPENGETQTWNRSVTITGGIKPNYYWYDQYDNGYEKPFDLRGLASGTYTLRLTVNPENADKLDETWYWNNVCETSFTVGTQAYSAASLPTFDVGAADFSAGNDNAVLALSYENANALSFPARYVIELCYRPDDNSSFGSSVPVYWGDTLPAYLPIEAYGVAVGARLRIIPTDGSGYETAIWSNGVMTLSYYSLDLQASESSFTPVTEGATSFAAGESIDLSIVNNSTDFDATQNYRLVLYAYDLVNDCWYGDGVIKSDSYRYQSDENEISISSWDVGLAAGKYELYAYLYYHPDTGGYYQNRDWSYLGNLTVYADDYGNLTVEEPVVTGTDVEIGYNFLTPSKAFIVRVDYESDTKKGYYAMPRAAWDKGVVSDSILLEGLDPNTEYTYTVSVYEGSDTKYTSAVLTSTEGAFTTGAAATPDEPVTPDYTLLVPGETSEDMHYGDELFYETFQADEDGTWEFTFSGPDGYVQVLDEAAKAWGDPVYFTTGGKTLRVPVTKGEPVHLRVFAYVSGTYCIEAPSVDFAYEYDDGCLSLNIVDADTQRCFVAAYTESGQMLVTTEIKTNGYHAVFANDARITTLRIFRMDKGTGASIAPAVEIPIETA